MDYLCAARERFVILCANPKAQYLARKAEIDQAISAVLDRGSYILGEETRAFEAEFATYVGAQHGIGVGNGTDALHIALAACGVGKGAEVITVAHTAVATAAAIVAAGAKPVFVDVESDYFTLSAEQLEAAITPRTRAIIPVHLYGQPADLEPIRAVARRHDLVVIEDCAQAHGARYQGRPVGSFGHAACFSFYPTKNLGALGDGGMVVTSDSGVAERARLLREYGWRQRYVSDTDGWNSRLDELQAAILRVKLRHLDADNSARSRIAARYSAGLRGVVLPQVRPQATHVYHLYVIRSERREQLRRHLERNGIAAAIHYPVPVHQQPAYRAYARTPLPVTERVATEILSLPIYPELSDQDADRVIGAINECVQEVAPSKDAIA